MKKKRTIIIMFFSGLIIILYPHIAQIVNNQLQKSEVSNFRNNQLPQKSIDDLMTKSIKYNQKINDDSVGFRDPFISDKEKIKQFKDYTELYTGHIFGVIEIPKLNLEIPIFLGSTDQILNQGIGQVKGSSLPIGGESTHTLLSGHRGMGTKAMFRNIDKLYPGDIFYIHNFKETLVYEVYNQKVIYPDQTESLEIELGQDLATLITCHPYRKNYQRLLIQAKRKK